MSQVITFPLSLGDSLGLLISTVIFERRRATNTHSNPPKLLTNRWEDNKEPDENKNIFPASSQGWWRMNVSSVRTRVEGT